jgi:hypothetical protein
MTNKLIINDQTTGKMEDELLRQLFLQTRSKINKERSNKKRKNILKSLEIDLCYIQREMSIRHGRKLFSKNLNQRVTKSR